MHLRQRYLSRQYLLGALLMFGIVLADLFIKRLVANTFSLGERLEIIPGFFAITYILNPGVAFGLLSGWESWLRLPLLLIFSLVAIGFIVYLYLGPLTNDKVARIALLLIAGGRISNGAIIGSRCGDRQDDEQGERPD